MKILIYTQARCLGGGTITLLTNLAGHLSQKNEITFAVMNSGEIAFFHRMAQYDHTCLRIADILSKQLHRTFDLVLCHFPYSIDEFAYLEGVRKIAVIFEIPGIDHIFIGTDNMGLFDDIIFISDAQIAHIPEAAGNGKFHRLDVIDDIDYTPEYHKTGNVGCIKNQFSVLCDVANRSPAVRSFRVYYGHGQLPRYVLNGICSVRSFIDRGFLRDSFRHGTQQHFNSHTRKLNKGTAMKALRFFLICHRLEIMGFEVSIERLFESFDCLLRTPHHSIGTSIAVHDALSCGKHVVLSDIAEHRRHFSRFKGVFFVNEIDHCLDSVVRSYTSTAFNEIRDCYLSIYDRTRVLADWEDIIAP